ncbi:MAG TPA: patatin-like phospholipase family protein [Gemmataceae bacterium]|jgi:predicted acylesterase/phospholipase RssA|nr:patatin-like phospholipase family protein [Gemmataceae bacterium]
MSAVEMGPGHWINPVLGRQGLVLSGGGAYAAYEVGVIKALLSGASRVTGFAPIKVEVVTGTSAGSLNAALLAALSGYDNRTNVEHLEWLWLSQLARARTACAVGAVRYRGDPRDYLNPRCILGTPAQLAANFVEDATFFTQEFFRRVSGFLDLRVPLGRRTLELVDLSALFSTVPFERILRRAFNLPAIRAASRALRIAATNWSTGELKLFSNADLTDDVGHSAIQASCAFPGLPPVSINGQLFVDGGYVMNTPLKPAVDAGADTLHIVYLDPDPKNLPVRRLYNTVDVLDTLYTTMMASIFNRDIDWAANVNAALDFLNQPGQATPARLQGYILTAAKIRERQAQSSPYRQITIHRYRPQGDLGGVLGLLNFDRAHIADLIEIGYRDTLAHDCIANECSLTAENEAAPPSSPQAQAAGSP